MQTISARVVLSSACGVKLNICCWCWWWCRQSSAAVSELQEGILQKVPLRAAACRGQPIF